MAPLLQRKELSPEDLKLLLSLQPDGFHAFYSACDPATQWSRSLSAFANSNGGDLYLGLKVQRNGALVLDPFLYTEEAEALLPVLREILPFEHLYGLTLHEVTGGYILQITVCRTNSLLCACDGAAYVRTGGKDTVCDNPENLRSLRREKGLCSYEDELTEYIMDDLLEHQTFRNALSAAGTNVSPYDFLRSRFLINAYNQLRVAGVLLYADCPQAMLPHRCGIRILRYCSDERKESRDDFPEEQSIIIEGPLSQLVPKALEAISVILRESEVVDTYGLRPTEYPIEALRELIENAVLHRDYSITRDIQIRIFTNRIEIESPGTFLSYLDPATRIAEQRVRNPKVMRLMGEVSQRPSRDLGKGLRRAFRSLRDAGLQSPTLRQGENSVIVTMGHERLADAQSLVLSYLEKHETITNSIARELTGIADANKMKQIFNQLKEKGILEIVPGTRSTSTQWRKVANSTVEEIDQISLF
ncbi:MAG: hypothetical protein IKM59_03590 [Oscillospiraceae bacterium]|nr:hypothetical protein [Oscillospiraceae bacterium]